MDWLNWYISDTEYLFQWYIIMPNIFGHIILPVTIFFYFCKYSGSFFQGIWSILYLFLSAVLYGAEKRLELPGTICLTAEILLLTGSGIAFLKRGWTQSLMVSVLIISLLSICNGFTEWLSYRVFLPLILSHKNWVQPSDAAREAFRVLLVWAFLTMVLNRFGKNLRKTDRQALFQLIIPIFFISLAERMIQSSFYGDVIEIDYYTHEILPVVTVNHTEILSLQIFAGISVAALLFAYEKIIKILHAEQKVQLLEQQAVLQETYVQEAVMRYRQTSSFRHDIKNHLTVVSELLKNGQGEKAREYLTHLENISAELSYLVNTGNAAVDALLGSKLSVADQKYISVRCEIKLPSKSKIKDLDWCIILSNALDNAIKACESVAPKERFIHIKSRKKGNFYLLVIENSCEKGTREAPKDGTGLSNIKAVAEKYHAIAENTVLDGRYKLKILFSCDFL